MSEYTTIEILSVSVELLALFGSFAYLMFTFMPLARPTYASLEIGIKRKLDVDSASRKRRLTLLVSKKEDTLYQGLRVRREAPLARFHEVNERVCVGSIMSGN